MQLSVELSMYPFNGDYLPPIKGFIDWLNEQPGIRLQTVATCTIITGDYDRVMDVLRDGFKVSMEQHGKAVFVAKFLPGFAALPEQDA
ncbi:YkoF family thiamine/hydroxymethylpyrimidine-binding protein [Gilvimarinus agarilyticus]|uniref:YkoF family thiamine/hydroxymethylpyrimidine-binding protein n=1 Tax=Gilvimarinus agarilyticus TaxID=679259 RepID=UPI00059F2581|nr:YkoF family thiamine/hydroxymethylpyrimidine-binding protein [Gilvimarinus agarilyticus]